MSASVILGFFAVTVSFIVTVSVTVLFSRALTSAFSTISSLHERSSRQQDKLIDRLVAIRWEDYAALRSATDETQEYGGFFTPEEQQEEPTGLDVPGYGTLSTLQDRLAAIASHEETLIKEDFGDEA